MKIKKLSKVFTLTIALSLIAVSLTACGGSKDGVKAAKEPVTASEAFNQEGIWFMYSNDGIVGKDEFISSILVFDGKGNAIDYNCSNLSFSDLKELSNDEIVTLVKEQDKASFEKEKENAINSIQGEIDEISSNPAAWLELASAHGIEFTNPDSIYKDLESGKSVTEIDNLKAEIESRKDIIDAFEYREPVVQPFSLHIETDKSGNSTESESLSYTYQKVNWGTLSDIWEINPESPNYEESEMKIELYPAPAIQDVYDMHFNGYSAIMTLVSEDHAGFMLDTPDTKGIEVD
ncbi:hypothetical protein LJC18_03065 [Lachnospiraceae bacterium OttesenSCG-928-E19]|nr:hypothetical protein [Lachnospiraceae bacterium OttesenSCG-928-E19]